MGWRELPPPPTGMGGPRQHPPGLGKPRGGQRAPLPSPDAARQASLCQTPGPKCPTLSPPVPSGPRVCQALPSPTLGAWSTAKTAFRPSGIGTDSPSPRAPRGSRRGLGWGVGVLSWVGKSKWPLPRGPHPTLASWLGPSCKMSPMSRPDPTSS